jgi:hypothetical protein
LKVMLSFPHTEITLQLQRYSKNSGDVVLESGAITVQNRLQAFLASPGQPLQLAEIRAAVIDTRITIPAQF